jgi:hypothetical protein
MRWLALPLCAVMSVACAKTEKPAAAPDTAAALAPAPAAPAAPAALALADVAGKWNVVGKNEKEDSTLVKYVLTATDDTTGWTIQFPDRKNSIPTHVTPGGDSIAFTSGPYPSAIRKNVQVSTNGSWRLVDGKLVGVTHAHYSVKTADSVLVLHSVGTRAP